MSHNEHNGCGARSLASIIAQSGVDPSHNDGSVAPPLHRVSTVAFHNHAAQIKEQRKHAYGRYGSRNCDAVAEIACALEEADNAVLAPSGLTALTVTLFAHLRAKAHVLVTDGVYSGMRRALPALAAQFQAEVEFYHPCCGSALEDLIRPNTAIIFAETPSHQTFELPDLPCHIAIAKRHGIPLVVDNTYSSGLYLKPLQLGADFVIQSLTKYFAGHSDILAGAILYNDTPTGNKVKKAMRGFGLRLAEDEAWLALRGARSMLARVPQQSHSALEIARWLEGHEAVAEVRHPALPSHPQHVLWRRDFSGATSTFGFALRDQEAYVLDGFMDALTMFHMGYSFGGYDSLITSFDVSSVREHSVWPAQGRGIRIHIGLDDTEDLKRDLSQAFAVAAGRKQ